LLVTKKGIEEGIVNDEWYEGNTIYFSNFMESELLSCLTQHNFDIDFLDTRTPYNSEIDVERIYIIASKKEHL